MQNQPFIEFVVEIITNENFLKQDDEHKQYIYGLIQETYDLRMQARYDAGHSAGWIEGMKKSIQIINEN